MKSIILRRLACALALSCLALTLATAASGCLGARLRRSLEANEGSFSDAPSLPKADFGRERSPMKQTGVDRRSREIEASLGVGD